MKSICKALGWALAAAVVFATPGIAKPGYGTLSGVVMDSTGTPQMGATVWLISEDAAGRTVSQFLSNQQGAFFTDRLKPGNYAVRVSLAGFLPAMEHHVAVIANLTTLLRVQVDSVFASLDTLRRRSDAPVEADDWKWVLRSSTATRAVLQWRDPDADFAANGNPTAMDRPVGQQPRTLVQLTSGALRPGSAANLPDAPATAISYDQRLGNMGRMLISGQMSYERGASGAFAGIWLPSGSAEGPETVFVMHQSKFGADALTFQEMRFDHTERIALGDRLALRAGAEYLRAGIVTSVAAVHPHAQLDASLAPGWTASLLFASNPPSVQWGQSGVLESAIGQLDSLPPVLFSNGRPVLEGGAHAELSVNHKLSDRSKVEIAVFHDSARHEAIFGSGPAASPDFVQDAFSSAFLYDGGGSNSWGTRAAYHQKITGNLEFAALYAWAGALSPSGELDAAAPDLRSSIETRNHHSVAARLSGKLPRSGTQFSASYKWIAGTTLSRMDAFGEATNQIDPNLHLSVRQPLPGSNGRWEALADFSNILAQGYVTSSGQDSRIAFVPVLRSFRGGVSFQF